MNPEQTEQQIDEIILQYVKDQMNGEEWDFDDMPDDEENFCEYVSDWLHNTVIHGTNCYFYENNRRRLDSFTFRQFTYLFKCAYDWHLQTGIVPDDITVSTFQPEQLSYYWHMILIARIQDIDTNSIWTEFYKNISNDDTDKTVILY